jgi:hypothetical protein
MTAHRVTLDTLLTDFWDFYDELLVSRRPTVEERVRLAAAFDTLFVTRTDYWALNDRIAKTWAKKTALLLVLSSSDIATQQSRGIGHALSGAQTRCQFRPAYSGGRQSR